LAAGEERATGTPNTVYDLTSVLYHALEGGATYETYIRDAEESGDGDLAEFFRQVQEEDRRRAQRARELLGKRLSAG
jgi:rubrerythrin